MSNPSTPPHIYASTPIRRARSLGLLVLFVGIYFTYLVVVTAIAPARSMVIDTLIVLAGAIGTGWFLLVTVEKRSWRELGIAVRRQTPREVGAGFVIPCVALLLVMGTLVVVRELIYGSDQGNFAAWLAGCAKLLLILAVAAAAEEALFRGYPFLKLVEVMGPRLATVLASAGFAFAHRHNPGVEGFALINIFVAGLMLSFAFLKTRSLWFVTAIHLGWNWAMAGPLDLPVSGLELFDTPMYEVIALGNPGWTGGGFGPEGGVSGLLALLLVTVAVWFYTKQQTLSND
jgi:uncharacterized protein